MENTENKINISEDVNSSLTTLIDWNKKIVPLVNEIPNPDKKFVGMYCWLALSLFCKFSLWYNTSVNVEKLKSVIDKKRNEFFDIIFKDDFSKLEKFQQNIVSHEPDTLSVTKINIYKNYWSKQSDNFSILMENCCNFLLCEYNDNSLEETYNVYLNYLTYLEETRFIAENKLKKYFAI